ncbi:hypothetical protein PVAND_000662 [Polypedilum vanderplanki]|uniref:non-specific serine/threonine protein kinase n=1 Tax=Polypedilum vanderplanki TaxID=319348 RepID=A0A9J6BKV7_POLVA|nr:hypothetical protein PVAND_000662 [Polypedilum vanderplanki]
MTEIVLKQGAEAKLYIGNYNGTICLVKERFVKNYRLPELDKTLSKQRIKAEQKSAKRCKDCGIKAPKIFHADFKERKVYMEYFDKAITVKDYIIEIQKDEEQIKLICQRIGNVVGKMHENNIIHGDLTTSNMLIDKNENDYELIMIDFGLSSYSTSNEDKGVDLYVLERALISTHSNLPQLFDEIIVHYKESYQASDETIKRFEEVRARGRKRTMIG